MDASIGVASWFDLAVLAAIVDPLLRQQKHRQATRTKDAGDQVLKMFVHAVSSP